MQSEVVLAFKGEDGAWREVEVTSRRFTIGRGADNDLVVDAPGVSRRHAVIESYDDGARAFDCQSQHGTLLNNAPIRGSVALRSGDLLTLGGACDITIRLREPHAPHAPPRLPPSSDTRPPSARPPSRAEASAQRPDGGWPAFIGAPAVVVAVAVLLILATGFLLFANRQPSPVASVEGDDGQSVTPASEPPSGTTAGREGGAATGGGEAAVGDEELERASARVVQRISGDDRPYSFPPEALGDIRRQVEEYGRSDGLRNAFIAMQRDARAVAAEARAVGVAPDLVIYAALAESDGSGRDPSAAARGMIPQLRSLRVLFGGDDADGSLIVLAAYTQGVGSKKSHPLLATMRTLARGNPFARRNVWYLRERGGLSDAAYSLVIRTIAAGVIAQDPRRYGMQAGPLVY